MLPNAQAPPDILKDSLSLRINRSMAQKADSNAPLTNSSLDQSKSKSLNVIKRAPLMKSLVIVISHLMWSHFKCSIY